MAFPIFVVDTTAYFDEIGAAVTPGTNIFIGHRGDDRRFKGGMDEVKFYSKILASNEVFAVKENTFPPARKWDQPIPQ